jgi:hypothetical protein
MLGLPTHGLHLMLVPLGLAGLTALLLPLLRQAQLTRRPASGRPESETEHDRRETEPRRRVQPERLTAPEAPPSGRPVDRDPAPWRAIAVFSSLAAAVVHTQALPDHLDAGLPVGVFFLAAALWQGVWAFQVSRSATEARMIAGILGSVVLLGLWLLSRTTGLPFGLAREEVGAHDVAAVAWQVCVVLGCAVGLRVSPLNHHKPLGRLGLRISAWVLLSAAVLALVSFTVAP